MFYGVKSQILLLEMSLVVCSFYVLDSHRNLANY